MFTLEASRAPRTGRPPGGAQDGGYFDALMPGATETRRQFARRHGFSRHLFRNGPGNVEVVLRRLGLSGVYLRYAKDLLGQCGLSSRLFDHGEIWGCESEPLAFVGHPYPPLAELREEAAKLRALGVPVLILEGQSYYGYGTVQVITQAPRSFEDR